MFPSKEAMLRSIEGVENQIKHLKDIVAYLRERKKIYIAMKTDGGRNAAKDIQSDIEQRMRHIKWLQEQKKMFREQGYRK